MDGTAIEPAALITCRKGLAMHLSLDQVLRASAIGAAPITGDLAGYLLLGVADSMATAPRMASRHTISLASSGLLDVAGESADEPQSVQSLRELLRAVLAVTRNPRLALERVAASARATSVARFVAELETALIPVNRAAAQRALGRLHRETARAIARGPLPAPCPAAVLGDATRVQASEVQTPTGEAVRGARGASVPVSDEKTPRVPEAELRPGVPKVREAFNSLCGTPGAPEGPRWDETQRVPEVAVRVAGADFAPLALPVGTVFEEPEAPGRTPITGSWLAVAQPAQAHPVADAQASAGSAVTGEDVWLEFDGDASEPADSSASGFATGGVPDVVVDALTANDFGGAEDVAASEAPWVKNFEPPPPDGSQASATTPIMGSVVSATVGHASQHTPHATDRPPTRLVRETDGLVAREARAEPDLGLSPASEHPGPGTSDRGDVEECQPGVESAALDGAPLRDDGDGAEVKEAVPNPAASNRGLEDDAARAPGVDADAASQHWVEPEAIESEAIESEAIESEAIESEAIESEAIESEAIEPEELVAEAVPADAAAAGGPGWDADARPTVGVTDGEMAVADGEIPHAAGASYEYAPRRSDVADLVAQFAVAAERTDKELSRDLKRLVGLSQTPPPVAIRASAPTADSQDEPRAVPSAAGKRKVRLPLPAGPRSEEIEAERPPR